MKSPLGNLRLEAEDDVVTSISYADALDADGASELQKQLDEYFLGRRVNFDLRLAPEGTLFQKQVWEEMQKIPYGETASYADIAKRIGRPEAWRAVANACGANPIVIVIPCHRVVGSHGRLGGYTGGTDRKLWLLELESKVASRIHRK